MSSCANLKTPTTILLCHCLWKSVQCKMICVLLYVNGSAYFLHFVKMIAVLSDCVQPYCDNGNVWGCINAFGKITSCFYFNTTFSTMFILGKQLQLAFKRATWAVMPRSPSYNKPLILHCCLAYGAMRRASKVQRQCHQT